VNEPDPDFRDEQTRRLLSAVDRAQLGQTLDELVGEQLRTVRRRFVVHGLCWSLLLPALVVLAAFLLDNFLRLPTPIRLFHTAITVGVVVWSVQRFLRYPLGKHLLPVDLATAIERRFPELHERLVSALQLKRLGDEGGPGLRNQSPEMIDALLQETAAHARTLPLHELYDTRRTGRLLLGSTASIVLLGGLAFSAPATAWAFVLRHLGADASYPRATTLIVELPPAGDELQRTDTDDRTELVLSAGADLHVSILAQGVVPPEVQLLVEAAGTSRALPTTPRGNARFRYVFRRVNESFTFRARGGDDERGDREVVVRTIHPPLVSEIRAELTPPTYTGRQPSVQSGGAIEALQGSGVAMSVRATSEVDRAVLVFLESGREIELERTTRTDDDGTIVLYATTFAVEQSDRYQVKLTGESGLSNPNPGTYPVTALEDYAPVGRWLLPDDASNTLLLPTAWLCVRGNARDDFGLTSAQLVVDAGEGVTTAEDLLPAPTEAGARMTAAGLLTMIELSGLLGQRPTDALSLQLTLQDNCEPTQGSTELPRRQVQIIDEAQLASAIARDFRSLREDAQQSLDLQLDRRDRLQELVDQGAVPSLLTAQVITSVEVGQGRVQASADRLHRGMMRAFDTHLFNRLDPSPNATQLISAYTEFHRSAASPLPHDPAFYRQLIDQRQQGTLGAMEQCLDPILGMIGSCERLAQDLSPPCLRLLAEAQVARNSDELQNRLRAAIDMQTQIVTCLEQLLARLEEWNDYQDLIQEARALREKQRDVLNRTEELRDRK
jgi:hypothetical protein